VESGVVTYFGSDIPPNLFKYIPSGLVPTAKGLQTDRSLRVYRSLVNSKNANIYNRVLRTPGFPLPFFLSYLLSQALFSHFLTLNMAGGEYEKVRSPSKSTEEQYAVTTARIKQIQSQLDSSVRAGKLKGKVCVVTGVGSLKGIG